MMVQSLINVRTPRQHQGAFTLSESERKTEIFKFFAHKTEVDANVFFLKNSSNKEKIPPEGFDPTISGLSNHCSAY